MGGGKVLLEGHKGGGEALVVGEQLLMSWCWKAMRSSRATRIEGGSWGPRRGSSGVMQRPPEEPPKTANNH